MSLYLKAKHMYLKTDLTMHALQGVKNFLELGMPFTTDSVFIPRYKLKF